MRDKVIITTLAALHIAVLSVLRFFPYPELFIYSYLTKAGLVPYTQIIDQHFPGVVFFPVNLATLGIDTVFEMRLLSLTLVVFSHLLIYKISLTLIKKRQLLFIPNLLFLIWHPFMEGYVLWIDNFAQVGLLLSFYFLISNNKKSKLFAGLALGLTFILKQTVAPLLLLIGIYLILRLKKRDVIQLLLGGGISIALLLVWVFSAGNWTDFYYWTVTFNLTTFSQMGRKLPSVGELVKVLPIVATPLFTLYVFGRKKIIEGKPILLLIFFFGSLFFAYARFDYVHLQPALPFAILALVYGLGRIKKETMTSILWIYIFLSLSLNILYLRHLVGTETHFFGNSENNLVEKVNRYRSGGKVFAFGTTPHIYYLTNTLPPGNVFVFQFPWFMKISEAKILNGLVNDEPEVIIRDSSAQVGGYNLIKYMPNILDFIDTNYKTIDKINGVEIMIKDK